MKFSTESFRSVLLDWYAASKRKLPWRETSDPYAILVSELMLQQTQVKTVIPYYQRFMDRFPTIEALAAAAEDRVLKAWQGLGYYRRVRHLQEAARQIITDHAGQFPRDKRDIDQLKGVGAYTSAAVASIAFKQNWACVDGNVIRVITRLLAIDDDVLRTETKRFISNRAQSLIDDGQPGEFNQAMMELGATVCTPRKPCCLTCPVGSFCRTLQAGDDPESRPYKGKRVQVSQVEYEMMFLFCGDSFLLAQRPEKGLMAEMWELPAQVKEDLIPWPTLLQPEPRFMEYLIKPTIHRFTHLRATYHIGVWQVRSRSEWIRRPSGYPRSGWFTAPQLSTVPITKVLQKLMPELRSYMEGNHSCRNELSDLPGMRNMN